MADTRLKIAVFIDFDNIEIGVKSTLGVQFDIGVVLEALKERGDVVSKIAYGDWTRAGDYSRSLTQHATKLVQRNLTPGGDKNGADINLALDALEMAFTHGHINAYVIVGGDSDFITLVEKLKQYDKQIFVVGGRAFTSMVMQRNCHEFIAYENLVNSDAARRPIADGRAEPRRQTSIEVAVPLVRRALKVLSDREVSPQLGLLKSTLLQLDSTFSERTYGAGSFRDFAQKLASAGHVVLARVGAQRARGAGGGQRRHGTEEPREPRPQQDSQPQYSQPQPRREAADAPQAAPADTAATNGGEPEPRTADGIREVRRLFQSAQNPPRWPMYIRQAKQFLRNVDARLRREEVRVRQSRRPVAGMPARGLFRIERDRQGVMRVFPGNIMQAAEPSDAVAGDDDNRGNVAEPAPSRMQPTSRRQSNGPRASTSAETEVVEGAVVQEMNAEQPVLDGEATIEESDAAPQPPAPAKGRSRGGRGRGKSAGAAKSASEPRSEGRRKTGEGAAPKARKTPAKPRAPRTRSRKETPAL